ncbi:ion channel [Sphingomonas sp. PAMC 26617]|uniref:ion channel n=1 Tax=Sphingomonas sp. PAMC 26617 TaxID=1112216 RepID=UPI0012F4DB1C|nr:ion channel [Sphingomonas sp. PAMC 26617]
MGTITIVAAAISALLHTVFQFGDYLTLMPSLLVILVAHQVFVGEVARSGMRKTAAGRWIGLFYFGVFLCILIAAYGYIFSQIGLHDSGSCACQTQNLGTGVFFSVITWTTVGYGDITATAPIARFFAAAEALNGYLVLALFVAALVPVFQQLLQGGPKTD